MNDFLYRATTDVSEELGRKVAAALVYELRERETWMRLIRDCKFDNELYSAPEFRK